MYTTVNKYRNRVTLIRNRFYGTIFGERIRATCLSACVKHNNFKKCNNKIYLLSFLLKNIQC